MSKPRLIAFYLPQYYPTPENDEWWQKGFTEWTNVGNARPLFRGHYQPRVPADLGYYDLRVPEVREEQVQLAREAGIEGFCYWHYWFAGRRLLDRVFTEVVESGKPDFPFCLCWANESWSRKLWNRDGSVAKNEVLVEQEYPGEVDIRKHFEALVSAFSDPRYMKIDGKPIFVVYRPLACRDLHKMIGVWNDLARENGLPGFYFVGYTLDVESEYDSIKALGVDAVCSCRMRRHKRGTMAWFLRKLLSLVTHMPECYHYRKVYPTLIGKEEAERDDVFPTLMPNWDHTPRSGANGYLFTNSTPKLFEEHAVDVLNKIAGKPKDKQICFLKSWNEWGEGNYMEPDLRYGKGYINALKRAIECVAR